MGKICTQIDEGTPRYACSDCSRCFSIIGKSLCKVKNRGCCWYFPKFYLYDIQKMSKSMEGLIVLDKIQNNPGTKIYNYFIHGKGYFDREGYDEYLKSDNHIETNDIEDHTIFFRACPFVKPGRGCSLPPRYRTFICNFFICKEITETIKEHGIFKTYEKERLCYSRWLDWENEGLKYILAEKNITLAENFDEVVKTLQGLPIDEYEFPYLEPIIIDDSWFRGA